MPATDPDHHSSQFFWDYVSGWEWSRWGESTLGREGEGAPGVTEDRCWPGAFGGFGGDVLGVLLDICPVLGRASRQRGSRAVTRGDNLPRDCGR